MNLKEIKEMINLMNENNLVELEMERDGLKIRLRKGGAGPEVQYVNHPAVSAPAPAPAAEKEPAAAAPAAEAKPDNAVQIKSPMVGTFYRAPSPESNPFVEVGQNIDVGQVVCIIEAMKLMNEIKAEVKGRVKEILVGNGEPVEFGQILFTVEPLGG